MKQTTKKSNPALHNTNKIIPISKLYEVCEKIYSQVEKYIDLEIPEGFEFYNNTSTNVFYLLEQSGLGIYYEAFNELFKPRNPLYNCVDNKVLPLAFVTNTLTW